MHIIYSSKILILHYVVGIYYGIIAAVIGDLLSPRFAEKGSGALMLTHAIAFLIKNPLTGK